MPEVIFHFPHELTPKAKEIKGMLDREDGAPDRIAFLEKLALDFLRLANSNDAIRKIIENEEAQNEDEVENGIDYALVHTSFSYTFQPIPPIKRLSKGTVVEVRLKLAHVDSETSDLKKDEITYFFTSLNNSHST